MIFQEPMTALNPVYTVGFQIAEMLRSHYSMAPKAARQRAIELLNWWRSPTPSGASTPTRTSCPAASGNGR